MAARAVQDDGSAGEANACADHIPLIGPGLLDNPQLEQREKNIDPAVSRIGPTRGSRVDAGEREREDAEGYQPGQGPDRAFAEPLAAAGSSIVIVHP